jgi:hypothetical protein
VRPAALAFILWLACPAWAGTVTVFLGEIGCGFGPFEPFNNCTVTTPPGVTLKIEGLVIQGMGSFHETLPPFGLVPDLLEPYPVPATGDLPGPLCAEGHCVLPLTHVYQIRDPFCCGAPYDYDFVIDVDPAIPEPAMAAPTAIALLAGWMFLKRWRRRA